MMRVFLGGEGVDELGRFAHAPAYAVESVRGREVAKEPGILEALVERLKKHPVELVGGLTWHRIPEGPGTGRHRTGRGSKRGRPRDGRPGCRMRCCCLRA